MRTHAPPRTNSVAPTMTARRPKANASGIPEHYVSEFLRLSSITSTRGFGVFIARLRRLIMGSSLSSSSLVGGRGPFR